MNVIVYAIWRLAGFLWLAGAIAVPEVPCYSSYDNIMQTR